MADGSEAFEAGVEQVGPRSHFNSLPASAMLRANLDGRTWRLLDTIQGLIAKYQKYLERRPVITKALTSGFLAALGDVTSQILLQVGKDGPKRINWRSTAAFAGFSMVITGPVTHYLYQFLEAVVPRKSNMASLRKVILERLIFAPPYLLALFYTVARMEGKSHSEAWTFIKAFYLSALFKNWIVWGLAQYVNMRYVPIKYRVLFANMVSLVWNCYIAIIKR